MIGNVRMNWNKDLKLNEEFEMRCVIFFIFDIFMNFSLQKERETEHFLLPGGGITRAELRPQAYAPSDDADFQIVKPYDSRAPFKPR
jgi:hypothetical protein